MTTTTLADLPTRFFQGQDRLKGPPPPELLAPSYRAEIVGFPPMDAAGHGEFGRAFYSGFPDMGHTIDETIVADDQVITRFTLRGTHTAPFMGIPATGRPITVSAFVILTVKDGKVTRLKALFDQLGLMRQLGSVPVWARAVTSSVSGTTAPSDPKAFPYDTHLDVLYRPLETVNVPSLVEACRHPWYNQTLTRVDDSVVRLGVIQGEYHWHHHDREDEFFYVLEGKLLVDLVDRTVELGPGQGITVPRGVEHRTRAPERAVILMVEGAGVTPTGD